MNTAAGPGAGIVDETIQFHGTADRYSLASASSLAMLYSNRTDSYCQSGCDDAKCGFQWRAGGGVYL